MDHENDVFTRAQAGNLVAFEELYQAHHAALYQYAYAELRNPEAAQTMTQETFVLAWQNLDRISSEDHFMHWLTRSARKHMANRTPSDIVRPGNTAPGAEESPALVFRRALANLPDIQRAVFILREWEGLGYAEIAQRVRISERAVISRLIRARQTLLAVPSSGNG